MNTAQRNRNRHIRRSLRRRIRDFESVTRSDESSGFYPPEERQEVEEAFIRCKASLIKFINKI